MFTIVGPKMKAALMGRPDWPEIERKMKLAYGQDWELITYDELLERKKKTNKEEA